MFLLFQKLIQKLRNGKDAIVIETTAANFIKNNILSEEVFGPFGIIVKCNSKDEMLQIANSYKGN